MKIRSAGKRNRIMERELQKKLSDLEQNPRYRNLPMLWMHNLDVELMDVIDLDADPIGDFHFVFSHNVFKKLGFLASFTELIISKINGY